jgi:hypothetical protein
LTPRSERRRGERGASLVELLAATAVGLCLAALFGHTATVYQSGYNRATTRVNDGQQAKFALALMAAEAEALLTTPRSSTCPAGGIHLADGRLEFAANLYDRSTSLREEAPIGESAVVVQTGGSFEVDDLMMVTDVRDPTDPSDDVADCARIIDISASRWTLERPFARPFPAGSPVVLVNRVAYALVRGLLMRTQDGGTQRVAQGVSEFSVRVEESSVLMRLVMRETGPWSRRVALEGGG